MLKASDSLTMEWTLLPGVNYFERPLKIIVAGHAPHPRPAALCQSGSVDMACLCQMGSANSSAKRMLIGTDCPTGNATEPEVPTRW
jgi:hypothetical protein